MGNHLHDNNVKWILHKLLRFFLRLLCSHKWQLFPLLCFWISQLIVHTWHFSESKVAPKDDSSKKPVCITESGASPNLPCIFPFQFNGVIRTTCIWDQAHLTEHKPWCSTLVDENGHHIGSQNNWGNCGPDCPISPNKQNETTTVPGRTWFLSFRAKRSF